MIETELALFKVQAERGAAFKAFSAACFNGSSSMSFGSSMELRTNDKGWQMEAKEKRAPIAGRRVRFLAGLNWNVLAKCGSVWIQFARD
jgi:hypothetical protein